MFSAGGGRYYCDYAGALTKSAGDVTCAVLHGETSHDANIVDARLSHAGAIAKKS